MQRIGLALLVWGLRFAALGSVVIWFISTRQYEATENSERTYFGLGWPDRWFESKVTLDFARLFGRMAPGRVRTGCVGL